MIANRGRRQMEFDINCDTASNTRIAYILTLLRSQFYESFKQAIEIFLGLIASP